MKDKNVPDSERIILYEYNVFSTSKNKGIIKKCPNAETLQDIFYKRKETISQYLNGNEEKLKNYFQSLGKYICFYFISYLDFL